MSVIPSPRPVSTLEPDNDFRDIHNWTESLHLFNQTFTDCHIEFNENTKHVVLFVFYSAIFVVGLVENVSVICVNCRRSGRVGMSNSYILNMAIADSGIISSSPVWMSEVMSEYTWLWGSFSCRFIHYFYLVNMYSSIFFSTCLSIDRYVTLTNTSPSWQRHQHRIRRAVCAGVWVLSAIIPSPEVVHIQSLDGSEPMCLFLAPFETYSAWASAVASSATISGFLSPFLLIAVFNISTACRLRRQRQTESRRHCSLMWAYIVVFAICWSPYQVTMSSLTSHGTHIFLHCHSVNLLYFFYEIIDCFSMSHCVANPILYNFLSPSFRGRSSSLVVRYLPKEQARAAGGRASSSSSTQHSIIITKEGSSPAAADLHTHPIRNVQASSPPPNTSPTLCNSVAS